MNIREFKILVWNLPDELNPGELSESSVARLWHFFDELKQELRRADEDELAQALRRIQALQARLGQQPQPEPPAAPTAVPAPAPTRAGRRQPEGDFTDYDLGIGERDEEDGDGMTQGNFLAELAEARASGAAKRRRLS